MSNQVIEATGKPCAVCPWRIANQGTPHPDGWYTKANLRRLWSKLRRGDMMTCHATDHLNPVPEGYKSVPEATPTRECSGAIIVQQREFMRMQGHFDAGGNLASYRRENPLGLTRDGALTIMGDALVVYPGETPRVRPNLNQPGIGVPDLPAWEPVG